MNIMTEKTAISIYPADKLPLTVDAIVEEQDTCLLLGKEPLIRESRESYPELVRKMERQKPLQPGQVLVRNTSPVRFVAIIYDIENNPVCCEEWIQASLKNIIMECQNREIVSLLMPLPGIKYGKINRDSAMDILKNTFQTGLSSYPEKIFIFEN